MTKIGVTINSIQPMNDGIAQNKIYSDIRCNSKQNDIDKI